MRISLRYGLPLLITACLVGLAFMFPAFVMHTIVTPVSRVVWLVVRGFLAIDQQVYWGVLILAVVGLLLRVAPIQREKYHSTAYGGMPTPEDRLVYWDRLIHAAETTSEARSTLARQLNEMQSNLEPATDETERRDDLLLPLKTGTRNGIQNFWNRVAHRWNLDQGKTTSTEFERELTSIIAKIESSLEIQNGKQDTEFDDR